MPKIGKTWSLIFDQPLPAQNTPARKTEWTHSDFSRIIGQAKQAFEEGRYKQCQTLTNIVLQNDPGNFEAQALQLALDSATQPLVNDAPPPPPVDVIDVFDSASQPSGALEWPSDPQTSDWTEPSPAPEWSNASEASEWQPVFSNASSDMASVEPAELNIEPLRGSRFARRARIAVPVALVTVAVVAAMFVFARMHQAGANQDAVPVAAGLQNAPAAPSDSQMPTAQTATALPAGLSPTRPPVVSPKIDSFEGTAHATPAVASTAPRGAAAPLPADVADGRGPKSPAAPAPTGTLAVNSTLPADIYEGDAYVGSTPATLQLTVGKHTLEYRYRNLRKMITHTIKPNEMTAAMISFEVQLQINARPWAQVFMENGGRRPLGQTPLSGVIVPAGSTLVFENPNFPSKRYRVTGTESAVQVVFP